MTTSYCHRTRKLLSTNNFDIMKYKSYFIKTVILQSILLNLFPSVYIDPAPTWIFSMVMHNDAAQTRILKMEMHIDAAPTWILSVVLHIDTAPSWKSQL